MGKLHRVELYERSVLLARAERKYCKCVDPGSIVRESIDHFHET